jgi:Cof subfamily protein (haloacid dehalogenase superfamily)
MSRSLEEFKPTAVLTDIDSTLLNSKRQLSLKNAEVIENYLIERQHKQKLPRLAICTGRHPATLVNTVLPIFNKLDPEAIHVVCDGAMLINSKAEVIWQEAISAPIVKKICTDIESLGASFGFGNGDTFYCGRSFYEERQGTELIKYVPAETITEDDSWLTSLICLTHLNNEAEAYIHGLNKTDFYLSKKTLSTFNHQPYYNLSLAGVSKAKGLQKWTEHYALQAENAVMIGDGPNDLEVMQDSIGVAVANADPEVKEMAKLVLDYSNDEDAVAYVLEKLMNL